MRKITLEDGSVRWEVMGQLLTEEEYEAKFLQPIEDEPGSSLIAWHKPVLSDALSVHPKQIPEAMARDKQHGLNVEYLPDGRAVITSQAQMRAMCKSFGWHQNNGGYSSGGK